MSLIASMSKNTALGIRSTLRNSCLPSLWAFGRYHVESTGITLLVVSFESKSMKDFGLRSLYLVIFGGYAGCFLSRGEEECVNMVYCECTCIYITVKIRR